MSPSGSTATVMGQQAVPGLLSALEGQGVVVFPSPVGYCLGTSSAAGVQRIFELKERSARQPLSVGGRPSVEAYHWLKELAALPREGLAQLQATLGVIGSPSDACPTFPEGVGQSASLALFLNLGPDIDQVLEGLQVTGQQLYLTSCNRSGRGNTLRASDIDPRILASIDCLHEDDSLILDRPAQAGPVLGSPLWLLGDQRFLRIGWEQERVESQLRAAGMLPPDHSLE